MLAGEYKPSNGTPYDRVTRAARRGQAGQCRSRRLRAYALSAGDNTCLPSYQPRESDVIPAHRRVIATALVAGLLLLQGGCGLRIAYNNLDRIVTWYVADVLELDRDQRDELRAAVRDLHQWHRHRHLPQYAALVREVSAEINADGIDAADLDAWRLRIEGWLLELADASLPTAIVTLRGLSATQVDALEANLDAYYQESMQAYRERSEAQWRDHWQEETADRFSERMGRLDASQQGLIADAAQRWQPDGALWAEFGRQWQREFIGVLRSDTDMTTFSRELRRLWVDSETMYPPQLTALNDHNDALSAALMQALAASLGERQRRRLVRNLEALAEDLTALAARS